MALTAQFSSEQAELDVTVVRGDTLSRKLFQVANEDDNPADLTGYEFSIQVRIVPRAASPFITIPNQYFIIGQSNEAIAYDAAEGNPPGTTRDEVLVNAPASLFQISPGNWYWDIQVTDPGGDIITPIAGRFRIIQDGTRTNE